jgi:hypothetical protein
MTLPDTASCDRKIDPQKERTRTEMSRNVPRRGDIHPPNEPSITKPQLQKLSIMRQREGYADDDAGRAAWFRWVETNIGRRVDTNKDLSKAEASALLDVLATAQAANHQ